MTWYLLKLALLLPLIGLLIWGSLKLTQKLSTGFHANQGREKSVHIVETVMLSPGLKLAVLNFRGREILVSTSRHGLTRLAEAPAETPDQPGNGDRA